MHVILWIIIFAIAILEGTNSSVPNALWNAVAMSSDGKYILLSTANAVSLYYSSDYGYSFNTYGGNSWHGVAISANGTYSVAGNVFSGTCNSNYIAINRSPTNPSFVAASGSISQCYVAFAMSVNGQYMYGTGSSGTMYSKTYGTNWVYSFNGPTVNNGNIACSSNGKYVTIADNDASLVKYSANFGIDWFSGTTSNSGNWYGVAMSSDASYNYLVGVSANVYYASNVSVTFNAVSASTYNAYSVACDSTGNNRLLNILLMFLNLCISGQYIAVGGPGNVYVSQNYGTSWTTVSSVSTCSSFIGTAMSKNGQVVIVVCGYINAGSAYIR